MQQTTLLLVLLLSFEENKALSPLNSLDSHEISSIILSEKTTKKYSRQMLINNNNNQIIKHYDHKMSMPV